jgi:hypothetical protein
MSHRGAPFPGDRHVPTPTTPEPALPAERGALVDDPTEGDDGAIHAFWSWLERQRTVQPSDDDTAGWAQLVALFDRGGGA